MVVGAGTVAETWKNALYAFGSGASTYPCTSGACGCCCAVFHPSRCTAATPCWAWLWGAWPQGATGRFSSFSRFSPSKHPTATKRYRQKWDF